MDVTHLPGGRRGLPEQVPLSDGHTPPIQESSRNGPTTSEGRTEQHLSEDRQSARSQTGLTADGENENVKSDGFPVTHFVLAHCSTALHISGTLQRLQGRTWYMVALHFLPFSEAAPRHGGPRAGQVKRHDPPGFEDQVPRRRGEPRQSDHCSLITMKPRP